MLTTSVTRSRNTAGARLRRAQELHLHPRPADRGDFTQSRQGAQVLGMEHWEPSGCPIGCDTHPGWN